MNSDRWQKVRQVLDQALELDAGSRESFAAQACAGDDETLREIQTMLRAYAQGGDLLEEPILRLSQSGESPQLRVGPYRLARLLGEGGMGKVYLGHRDDDTYQKDVAIKILRRGLEGGEMQRRFASERQILANLAHPYIAQLLDGGTTESGQPFLVMELVKGIPIVDFCHRRELTVEQRLRLVLKVCEAIQFAHRNLVVHRDLKPSNILVTEDGTPKLLDFGIAKILRQEGFQQTVLPTRTGILPMTPEYASPEQVRGESVTTAADVYALGLLLYELLSGKRPYRISGGGLEAIVETVCRRIPPKPSTAVLEIAADDAQPLDDSRRLSRRLAGDLDAIVMRALRKEPTERYGSVAQMAEDLGRHLDGRPVTSRRGTVAYLMTKFVRRHRLAVGSVAAAFLMLLGFVGMLLAQQRQILNQSDRILRERNRAEEVSSWLLELFELPAPNRSRGEQVTARELLDKGATSIDQDIQDLELKAELKSTMGHTYMQLGLLREGIELLEQSIELTPSSEASPPEVLNERLRRLTEGLTLAGEFQRAEVVARRVLARSLEVADTDAMRALALTRVGHLRGLLGDPHEADKLLSQALVAARSADDPLVLAKTLEYRGDERMRRGDLAQAKTVFQEALDLLRRVHGDQHPDVALLTSSLARAVQGFDHGEARQLFEEAIANQRQLFDEPHPVLATALNNLALLHLDLRHFAEAKELLAEAVAMQKELHGEQHPKFATMLANLAITEKSLGNRGRAEQLYRQAIEVFHSRLGDQHPEYALALSNLAELLIGEQELNEASRLVDQALEITRGVYGDEHPRITTILNARGQVELMRGDLEAAVATLESAVDVAERSLGDRHSILPATLMNLAVTQDRLGKLEDAAESMTRALALIERPGEPTDRRLECLTWLANLELRLQRYQAAERDGRIGYEGWRKRAGASNVWTFSAQMTLGSALIELGRLAEAELLLVDLVEKLEAVQPAESRRLERARQALAESQRRLGKL